MGQLKGRERAWQDPLIYSACKIPNGNAGLGEVGIGIKIAGRCLRCGDGPVLSAGSEGAG